VAEVTADCQSAVGPGEPTPSADESATDDRRATGRYSYMITMVEDLHTPATIDQLVDRMYEWERERGPDRDEKSWNDVHRELYLVDLPVLDRTGALTFDIDRGVIEIDRGAE
jgi:hypothetical protein